MKNKIRIFILSLFLVLGVGGAYYYEIYIKKLEIKGQIELKRGEKISSFLSNLEVKENLFTKVYFRISKVTREVKAGKYNIDKEITMYSFFQLLKEGKVQMSKLTIPEGFTTKQIKELLQSKQIMTNEEFDKALLEIEFPYLTPNNNFDGYFFPETYYFNEGTTPKTIIETILKEFLKNYPIDIYGSNKKSKKEFYEQLILASIIEREAVLDKEKPIIASVFYNRLKKGMKLESDATVNYVFDYKKRRLYYKDLKIDSPYNTYMSYGLPPTPIGNPGKHAIDASLNPDNTEYYFFVATYDGTGSHYFTKTYREHINYQKQNKNKPK